MPTLELTGNLLAGPAAGVSETGTVPTAEITDLLAFSTGTTLSYGVSTGMMVRNVATASPLTLYGVGAADAVTKARVLYIRTQAPMVFVLTFDDNSTATVPVTGLFLYEASAGKYVKGITVTGTGIVQYAAFGDQ
jgi:hypothetical protein